MKQDLKRNFGLDFIRAMAILLVMVSHTTFLLPRQSGIMIDALRLLGATGVDIFFVLSGFLVGGIILKLLSNKHTTFNDLYFFWKRRWFRTLPNYIVVLIVNVCVYFIFQGAIPDHIWMYFVFIQNFIQIHPDFFAEAWSLSIEEYAYIILPLLIFLQISMFKMRFKHRVFISTTILIILLLTLIKYIHGLNAVSTTFQEWSQSFRKVVLYRLDAIYIGFVLVYLRWHNSNFFRYKKIFLTISVGIFIIINIAIVIFSLNPINHKLFFYLGYLSLTSSSIACAFPFLLELKAKQAIKQIITYISKRSYALYLVNYSLVLLVIKEHDFNTKSLIVIYWLLSFFLAEILYRSIETYFLNIREKVVPRRV